MANIGDIFASLRVDDSKLGPEIERAGGKAADSFAGRFRTAVLGPGFATGIGAGVTLGAIGMLSGAVSGLADMLADATRKAIEDEASQRKLAQTLQENVPSWDGATEAVEAFIRKGQDLAFGDDEIRESIGALATATGDVGEAMDISRTAMDLARLKSIDLKQATDIVAKAYAGNIGALRRILPWIDKNADATEALAAIQKAAEGQAESYASTTEGKLVRAQQQLDEAMESLGRSTMPLMAASADVLATQMRWVGRAVDDVNEGLATLGGLIPKAEGEFDALGWTLKNIPFVGAWIRTNELRDAQDEAADAAREHADAVRETRGELFWFDKALKETAEEVPEAVQLGIDRSVKIAAQLPADLAAALREKRATWQDALALLGTDLENEMTRLQEIALLEAALIGPEIVRGLQSKDPVVKAQAEATTRLIVDRLGELQHLSMGWGESTGNAYADGLEKSKLKVGRAAAGVAGVVRNVFEAYSPPGPDSPLHEIDVWGYRTGMAWAEGLAGGLVAGKNGVMAALGGSLGAPGAGAYAGILATVPAPVASSAPATSPAIVRLEIGGRPLMDYIDENLAYRVRR